VKRRKKSRSKPTSLSSCTTDGRSTRDRVLQVDVAPIEIDDPSGTNDGDKIVVLRQLRGDPLARLHSHRQIDQAQFLAGRAYQRDWEAAEKGTHAIDPTRERVDGARRIEPLSQRQVRARARLAGIRGALGRKMHAVVHAVLIDGATMEALAQRYAREGESWAKYYGRLFRDALDALAVEYKLAGRRR
jgi:hypothetical protein